jgi:hypothetical protein
MSESRAKRSEEGTGPVALPRSAYRAFDDAALIAAMQRRDEHAIDEFIVRFQRLLGDRLRQWRVSLAGADDTLSDVVEDIAVLIVNRRIAPTKSLAAYVVKAFRARLALSSKSDAGRVETVNAVAEPAVGATESAVVASVSQESIRASRGADWEPSPPAAALTRLSTRLASEVTAEERQILVWLSNYVPQREICNWLGTSYAAGTQRIWRLRERLRVAARQYAKSLGPQEQAELARLFRWVNESVPPRGRRRAASAEVDQTGVSDDDA